MALTADIEYQTKVGTSETVNHLGGAADTLYKGAIVNIGTDGYLKVAADVANEIPRGVVKKQVIEDGTHKNVEVETGVIRIAHSGAAQTDVGALFYATADDTLADSATNVGALGMCVDWATGYLWIDTRIRQIS
jgi:hypothetical protein